MGFVGKGPNFEFDVISKKNAAYDVWFWHKKNYYGKNIILIE